MINVTKAYLPDLSEYVRYLENIWDSAWLTNHGPLITKLEQDLKEHLGVKHLFVVNNGTIAIQIALRALDLSGEIITTPFSYVATTSSIVWEHYKPIFVDIDENSLTIDPELIESAITPKTKAILAVHVYGNPCKVETIEEIAKRHKLKVIYDAAHAFGVNYEGTSVLNYGDISTLSFHATKLFHTVEGGAIVTSNDLLAHKISYLRNFGHSSPETFYDVGINGKNSEFHAAMGLCILPKIRNIIQRRKEISDLYDKTFLELKSLRRPLISDKTEYNYSYYPVIFESEEDLLHTKSALLDNSVSTRRYFYPSLNTLSYVEAQQMPVSEDISKRILCLPLYPDLSDSKVIMIAKCILETCNSKEARLISQG
ncbi:MAG TPA: DegT/DnrJ/EryC1/StrS family aminotransferase [Oligoflexia bacterium]|nr:DegT/DnrJ/EryC1/StrS family aminotransferase [Oligoflexia bacterium]HMP48952.1 DegT/DnrJ/EryC1/StrS family aminotransferase [Oligoflexia bacterium]